MADESQRQNAWWRGLSTVVAVFLIGAIASCGDTGSGDGDSSGGGGGGSEEKAAKPKEESKACGSEATDDCTPSVGANGKVRVDALTWQVKGAETASALGDQSLGLGEKADGVFVIVNLSVHSDKNESATLSDEVVQLEGKGAKYDVDAEGTTAAIGAGEDPLFLEDLGPDQSTTSKVVFDVPPSVLKQKPRLRFNELGFGSTHGFIALPAAVAR